MKEIIKKYKVHYGDRKFVMSMVTAIILFIVSLFVNFYASIYATESASNSVTDIILSNIRTFDVDGLFIYGGLALVISIIILCLYEPKKFPFIVKSISLFILVRSLFITLTHIGPFPNQIIVSYQNFAGYFTSGGDLFFSGHTGLPFLMALIYWNNKLIRFVYLGLSITFGAIVLLGHLHYSIDVLSAFFITYTIFCISEVFFKKDRSLFAS